MKQQIVTMFGFRKLTISSSSKACSEPLVLLCHLAYRETALHTVRREKLTAMTRLHLDTHRETHYFGTLLPLLDVLSGERWWKHLRNLRTENIVMCKHQNVLLTQDEPGINLASRRPPDFHRWWLTFKPEQSPSSHFFLSGIRHCHSHTNSHQLATVTAVIKAATGCRPAHPHGNNKAFIWGCITNPGSPANMHTWQTWWNGVNHTLLNHLLHHKTLMCYLQIHTGVQKHRTNNAFC